MATDLFGDAFLDLLGIVRQSHQIHTNFAISTSRHPKKYTRAVVGRIEIDRRIQVGRFLQIQQSMHSPRLVGQSGVRKLDAYEAWLPFAFPIKDWHFSGRIQALFL